MSMILTLFFLSILFESMILNVTQRVKRTNCFAPPILAPEQDCRDILASLNARAPSAERDWTRLWGRRLKVTNSSQTALPHGFQLRRPFPSPARQSAKRCEIHVDNNIDHFDEVARFKLSDVVQAGNQIMNMCYPSYLTGKTYPGPTRMVYVTTIYVPSYDEPGEGVTVLEPPSEITEEDVVDEGTKVT